MARVVSRQSKLRPRFATSDGGPALRSLGVGGRSVAAAPIESLNGSEQSRKQDLLAVEEPLQIRISFAGNGRRETQDVAITMRTPGQDAELAAGFLFSEGILKEPGQVLRIRQSRGIAAGKQDRNRVIVDLRPGVKFDARLLRRNFYVSSSCGVCGKTSIESLCSRMPFRLPATAPAVEPAVIYGLPPALHKAQSAFQHTGGLHAAALFDFAGKLLSVQEDVGRHNAVDKLIGTEFLTGRLPRNDALLLVSGRASFELVQKALMAGIPMLVAVGAPSTLAVQTALRFQMTLIGFLRQDRFNVYSGAGRLRKAQVQVNQNEDESATQFYPAPAGQGGPR
jgi:FdhD protein